MNKKIAVLPILAPLGGCIMSQFKVFDDVPSTHPAYRSIGRLGGEGYVAGCQTEPPKFCPNRAMTRAEIAVLIVRAVNGATYEPPAPVGLYPDVPVDFWGAKWIEDAEGMGAMDDGLFHPDIPARRSDVAVLFDLSIH